MKSVGTGKSSLFDAGRSRHQTLLWSSLRALGQGRQEIFAREKRGKCSRKVWLRCWFKTQYYPKLGPPKCHLSFVGNSSALGMLEVLTCAYRIIFVDHVLQGCRATALVSLTLSKQPWAWNGELGCELGNRRCISPELSMQFQNHFSSLSPSLSADHVIHYILNRCTKVDRVSAKYIMMYLTALYVLELFELGWSAERNVLHTFSESYSSTRRPSSDRPRNQFPYATIWMMIFSWCVSQI